MRRLTSIVALNRQGAIGCRNALPWRLRTDMAYFREQTMGHVVIMGRKTFDSLDRRPLPGRYNVVVSHNFGLCPTSDTLASATGIGEALALAEAAPKKFGEIFVVGGQTMYEQFGPLVDRYLMTIVDMPVQDADTFFGEDLISGPEWESHPVMSVAASIGVDEAAFTVTELFRARTPERKEARTALEARSVRKRPPAANVKRAEKAIAPAISAFL